MRALEGEKSSGMINLPFGSSILFGKSYSVGNLA